MNSTLKSTVSSSLICGLLLLLLGAVVQVQNPAQPKRGFYPAGSYSVSEVESVNTTNGNVILRIPLVSLPAGRAGLSAGVGLFYNSKIWDTYSFQDGRFESQSYTTMIKPSQSGGWRYGIKYELQIVQRWQESTVIYHGCDDEYLNNWKVKMKFPDGSEHVFRPTGHTDQLGDNFFRTNPGGWQYNCPTAGGDTHVITSGMTYYSADGTFMRLTVEPDSDNDPANNAWTLSLPDGSHVTGGAPGAPERIYDRNNNYVEIRTITYNNDPGAIEVVDQLGRRIVIEHVPATGRDYIHAWRNNATGQLTELIWTVQWQSIYVTNRYYANSEDIITGTTFAPEGAPAGISSITLPAQMGQLSYTFAYDLAINPWGEVSSMTLPSGAQTKYRFASNGIMGADVLKNSVYEKELIYDREYDNSSTSASELWQYSIAENFAQITGPDQGVTREYFKQTNVATWDSGLVYKTENADGSVVERIWKQNIPTGYGTHTPAIANSYLKTQYVSIRNAAGTLVKTATKDYTYDKNGNLTQQADYDWVDYGTTARDGAGNPTGALPATLKRVSVNTYYNPTPTADSTSSDADIYTQYTANNIRNALESTELRSGLSETTALSRTEMFYDDAGTTGNLIAKKDWDSTKNGLTRPLTTNNSISISHQHDSYGNTILTIDPGLTKTQWVYGAIAGVTGLYPTQIKSAFETSLVRTETREYDFHNGLATRVTDEDNHVSSVTTYDLFARPILVRAAAGEDEETQTATEYSDVHRRVIVRSDLNLAGDGLLVTIQHYDKLGRIRLSRRLENAAQQTATDETTGIKVQTRYMFSGTNSYQLVSNPYRAAVSSSAGSEVTMGWSRSKTDSGGRLIQVQTFGGPTLPAPWGANSTPTGTVTTAYNAEFTTVTDQDSRLRRSRADGLGRLARLDEPDKDTGVLDDQSGNPVQPTTYLYDAAGNLRQITQGQQERFFAYDSLSRLLRAGNPEQQPNTNLPPLTDPLTDHSQWTMAYDYDDSGNLLHKIDARGVVSTYTYDALDRNLTIVYTNDPAGTPSITHTYDTATLGKGRLKSTQTSGATGSLTTIQTYDALGRIKGSTQTLGSKSYPLSYTYDLAGHVKTIDYPSGNKVTNTYDTGGRLQSFVGNLGGAAQERNYSTNISYTPGGALSQEQLGTTTPIYNKLFYNSRGQLAEIREGLTPNNDSWERGAIINFYSTCWGMCYVNGASQSMPGNNGNLKTQQHWIQDGNNSVLAAPEQHFQYDQLNRLKLVYEGPPSQPDWQQQFVYDRYGNRTLTANSLLYNAFEVETSTNHLLAPGDSGLLAANRRMDYDKAGNLTRDSYLSQGQRTYDAESRMTQALANNHSQEYVYDGDGNRVRRKVDNVWTWQVYGHGGELLAEYAENDDHTLPQKEYGYRNGQLLITATPETENWGAPPSFTPPAELVTDVAIKLEHLTELRTAVNQVRVHAGLPPASFTVDPNPERNVTTVKADHILQLRSALEGARNSLGLSVGGYAHTGLQATDPIYAIDFQELRNQVLSAWNTGGAAADIRWLVPDQLGTPRMIFDQSGSLANVSRHDYLPFGENLTAAARGTSVGYGKTDGARQKFTGKERDDETKLDYFLARYYSPVQGRFTSPDEFTGGPDELYDFAEAASANPTFYADLGNPQSLNKYQYAYGNPLRYTDPDGHCPDGQPCPTTSIPPSSPSPTGGYVSGFTADLAISGAKVVGNIYVGMYNIGGAIVDGRNAPQLESFEPTSKVQTVAMRAIETVALLAPLLGKTGPAAVMSAESKPAAAATASTLKPGPNAAGSIPARGPQRNFTRAERTAGNKIGDKSGCHTCGAAGPGTKSGNWVLDHQDPTGVNLSGAPQRLFPQCLACSRKQGGDVNAWRRGLPGSQK
jgi:RHS repeat-associated protein